MTPEGLLGCVANVSRGTGVGLVNEVQPAGVMVNEVREQAKAIIYGLADLV